MLLRAFEQACEELEATSSRSGKEVILKAACQNSTVERLFVCAINPLVQFYVSVDEHSGNCEVEENHVWTLLAALQLRTPGFIEEVRKAKLGKWVSRLINKKLNVGVSVGTLKKILPGNSFALSSLSFEKADLNSQEWYELLHHLEGSRKYLVQYEYVGIRCLVSILNGRICPVAEVPLIRFEGIEEPLVSMFPDGTILEGRLISPDLALGDLYAWVTSAPMKVEVGDGPALMFQILDVVAEGKFSERQRKIAEHYNFSYTQVLWQEPEAIRLDCLDQPKSAQERNSTLLLRHPDGERTSESSHKHNWSVKVRF